MGEVTYTVASKNWVSAFYTIEKTRKMSLLDTRTQRVLDNSLVDLLGSGRDATPRSVLMFSGGRDSTLAALRMRDRGIAPVLVTISSWHLVGIDRVRQRFREIEQLLPIGTPWLVLRQPDELKTDTSFYEQTCLPCHHAYVIVGAAVAAKAGIGALGFGYASYQSAWPEQTPFAVERLGKVLRLHDIRLDLPVYDIGSREQALKELAAKGLSTAALEQKCIRQVTNVALTPERLIQQVNLWERAIDASMAALPSIEIEVIEVNSTGTS